MTDTPAKPPDERTPRRSRKAAIREDESDGRSFFSVTFPRLHRTDDGSRSTGSCGLNGLPHLAMTADRTHQAVHERTPDFRGWSISRGATTGVTFVLAEVNTPFR